MKEKKTRNLVHAALIAAVYIVLIMVFRPISFGPIQFRIAEALCVLPYFTPAAIPGLFIGCLISNLLGGAMLMDVIHSADPCQYPDHPVGIKVCIWIRGYDLVYDGYRWNRRDSGHRRFRSLFAECTDETPFRYFW